ncbi:hypothetical protein CPB83DRAFT_841154 [Crepidotus variabilis]|uniref:Uncharacterized protein n=1 Tax=Crepidotus variabilis TaxID=179855 RepID=A0A9P6E305_9AGAR|nr:hypothetical protein CPB83DRAFT_841154 [Crepidotus variabilis]
MSTAPKGRDGKREPTKSRNRGEGNVAPPSVAPSASGTKSASHETPLERKKRELAEAMKKKAALEEEIAKAVEEEKQAKAAKKIEEERKAEKLAKVKEAEERRAKKQKEKEEREEAGKSDGDGEVVVVEKKAKGKAKAKPTKAPKSVATIGNTDDEGETRRIQLPTVCTHCVRAGPEVAKQCKLAEDTLQYVVQYRAAFKSGAPLPKPGRRTPRRCQPFHCEDVPFDDEEKEKSKAQPLTKEDMEDLVQRLRDVLPEDLREEMRRGFRMLAKVLLAPNGVALAQALFPAQPGDSDYEDMDVDPTGGGDQEAPKSAVVAGGRLVPRPEEEEEDEVVAEAVLNKDGDGDEDDDDNDELENDDGAGKKSKEGKPKPKKQGKPPKKQAKAKRDASRDSSSPPTDHREDVDESQVAKPVSKTRPPPLKRKTHPAPEMSEPEAGPSGSQNPRPVKRGRSARTSPTGSIHATPAPPTQ